MKNIFDFFTALFTDIINFFKEKPDFGGPITSGQMIILAIALGCIAYAVSSYLTGVFLGKFIKALLSAKAESPESAVSAETNFFVRYALKSKNGVFAKIVNSPENQPDKYYILPKNQSRAENLYAKNSASPAGLIFTVVLILIIAAAAYIVIPELVNMTSNFAYSLKSEPNIA